MWYQRLGKTILFHLTKGNPDRAHELAVTLMKTLGELPWLPGMVSDALTVRDGRFVQQVCGIRFTRPVGLAAGCDINAEALHGFAMLGFGFLEVGTITLDPQEGNPSPRVLRLPEDHALLNRKGFRNAGVETVIANLADAGTLGIPIGVNIGKGTDTPLERAAYEYSVLYEKVAPYADYVAINVSSPNTPGLRKLLEQEQLANILKQLHIAARTAQTLGRRAPPWFVKISPDASEAECAATVDVCASLAHGIIAVNTTRDRSGIVSAPDMDGGISGRPLFRKALATVSFIHRRTQGRLPIIGVGGIESPADATAMLNEGASLLQVYSALVYSGPFLIHLLHKGILERMVDDGANSLKDLARITAARRLRERSTVS